MSNLIVIVVLLVIVAWAVKESAKHLHGEGGCCGGGSCERSAKPEKKKLPEAIRKKIRTELKDEKLPAGKYTSIYKAVEESENKLALNNALVKTFDTTIGSKIYNHIKKIYEDYQR